MRSRIVKQVLSSLICLSFSLSSLAKSTSVKNINTAQEEGSASNFWSFAGVFGAFSLYAWSIYQYMVGDHQDPVVEPDPVDHDTTAGVNPDDSGSDDNDGELQNCQWCPTYLSELRTAYREYMKEKRKYGVGIASALKLRQVFNDAFREFTEMDRRRNHMGLGVQGFRELLEAYRSLIKDVEKALSHVPHINLH